MSELFFFCKVTQLTVLACEEEKKTVTARCGVWRKMKSSASSVLVCAAVIHPDRSAMRFKSNSARLPLKKHCLKILWATLFNSVSNKLLPLKVGQSHDSFTLLVLFQYCQQAIQGLCPGYIYEVLVCSKPEYQVTCFCVHE
jgi:hypothetical protein